MSRPADYTLKGVIDWHSKSACFLADLSQHDCFHPEDEEGELGWYKYCSQCNTIRQCIDYAMDEGCEGIYGGMTTNERKSAAKSGDTERILKAHIRHLEARRSVRSA